MKEENQQQQQNPRKVKKINYQPENTKTVRQQQIVLKFKSFINEKVHNLRIKIDNTNCISSFELWFT